LSVPATATLLAPTTSAVSTKTSLWDRAYDKLQESEEVLVTEYEELLQRQMRFTISSSPITDDASNNLQCHAKLTKIFTIDRKDRQKSTALALAAKGGHGEVMRMLLETARVMSIQTIAKC
jgi:hypothetical protein